MGKNIRRFEWDHFQPDLRPKQCRKIDFKIFESKKNTIHENETSDNYYVVKVISDSEVKFNNEKFNVVQKSVNKIYGIDNLQQITKILENKFPISVNKNLLNKFIDRMQY